MFLISSNPTEAWLIHGSTLSDNVVGFYLNAINLALRNPSGPMPNGFSLPTDLSFFNSTLSQSWADYDVISTDGYENGRLVGSGPLNSLSISITAPLHDEEGLLMTTSDYSNFADKDYFNDDKNNHSGTDLALSADGSRTGSTDTASTAGDPVYAHAICDGQVINWNFNKNNPDLSYMQVLHPNCGGRDVIAYYGHIEPNPGLTLEVKKDDILGTVMPYKPIICSHLHLTLDTQTQRDLFSKRYEICDYVLDASTQTVTGLSNCAFSSSKTKLAANKMLLRIGYGKVTTERYTNSNGKQSTTSLYISEPAMRQLGFISFFDLY